MGVAGGVPDPRLPYPAAVALVILGVGLLLTLCDRFAHVQFGVLAYAEPLCFGQAWWTFPNFLGAATGLYFAAKLTVAARFPVPANRDLLFSAAWFVAAYFATGLFAAWPTLLLAGLLAAFFVRLAAWPHRGALLAFAVLIALVGCGIEGAQAQAGGFAYRDPQVFNVPYWLAALYFNGSFLALQVVRRVEGHYGRVPGGPA